MEPAPNGGMRPAVAIYRAPLFNASETFVRAHALGLTRYRTLLAGLWDKGNIPRELSEALFLPRGVSATALARLGSPRGLAGALRAEAPALVHAHFGPDARAALPLARALGVPLVTTLHGYDVTRDPMRMLLSGRLSWMRYAVGRRDLMREGDLFLAVSDAIRERALAQGFPPERTETHYLGVDLERFRPGGDRDPHLVLHVGRLVEKKGTAVLVDAIARVPNARLLVLGDGPARAALQRRAAPLGKRVRFAGGVAHSEIAEWMRRAVLLAAPSVIASDGDAEGLPTTVVEAAASGLPVVAAQHSGIPEAVRDGETGFLVPEHDAEALAARIAALLASTQLRTGMGAAARRFAESRFDARVQSVRLEEIYDRLRGQTRP